jgi:RNA polymerase sigma-70 factor (ECF subfamily)
MQAKQIFEILMRENSQMLITYLRAVVGAQHLVDEIFQETMLTAWQKLHDFDNTRPFGPWLRGIAKNHLFSHYRASKREVLMCNEQVLDFLEQKIHSLEQQSGDTWDEKISPLKQCIELLPDTYRQVIEARYINEQKSAFVRQQLAISKEAFKKRLQRAKQMLYKCIVMKATTEH